MGDRMRSVPFTGLLERISGELKGQKSIFSIPEYSFYRSEGKHSIKVFTQEAATPVGPAGTCGRSSYPACTEHNHIISHRCKIH